jgi:hypothetical protein
VTQESRPDVDTMPAAIGLARLAAALTAWDASSGSSCARTGASAAGGTGAGSSPARPGRGGGAPTAGTSEIPSGGAGGSPA